MTRLFAWLKQLFTRAESAPLRFPPHPTYSRGPQRRRKHRRS